MRLRARLVLLILATMIPMLAYSAVTQFIRYRAAEQRAASGLADVKARAVGQAVHARLVALRVLALEPELQTGDFAGFRRAAEVVIANELPGANILVLTEDARQMMNTAAPPGAELPPRTQLESLRRLFETGGPVLSDLFIGAMLKRPVVAIEVPVRNAAGKVIYDLALNPTPSAFLDPIIDDRATSAITTVYDSQGVIVTRSREHEEFVGRKAPEPLLSRILGRDHAMLRLEGAGGGDKVVALSRVEPYGWTVAVELAGDELSNAALRSLLPTLAVGGLLVVLSAVLAVIAAQRIAGPIDALRRMGEDPSGKDWVLLSRLPEVREAALTLNAARQRVKERTAALERAVGHRDLLLREVHHRVKNNLQMVDAMLAMQGRRNSDPATLTSLAQLRDRVHALAVVHAQLMASDDLRTFDAAGFLRELAEGLSASLGTRERPIRVAVDADAFGITLDLATPLGLLLTELVTNSANHAYRGSGGAVRVRLRRVAEREAELLVEDDGANPAAAERFSAEGPGIGGKLVRGFVKQLDATLHVEHDHGMRILIRFPLPEDSK